MNDLQEKFLDTRFEMLSSEGMRDFWIIKAWNPDGVVANAAQKRSQTRRRRHIPPSRGVESLSIT